MPVTTRPVRSTRNKTVNYADYDIEYAADADYDSDYVPPTAADFRTTTTARRSARVNDTRNSTDSSSSSHGYNTRRRGGQ